MTDYEMKIRQRNAEDFTRKNVKDDAENKRLISDIYEIVKKWSKDTTQAIYEEKAKKADIDKEVITGKIRNVQAHRIAVGNGIKRRTKK